MHVKHTPSRPHRLTRDESRQRTREKLRDAAMQEFAWQGVAGTSAERIAEIAGFTRGAFYANYANKQDLLLDLLGARMEAEQASWIALANAPANLEATLQLLDERARAFDPDG